MTTTICILHYNPHLAIGLQDVKNAWLFPPAAEPVKLTIAVYQGQLSYRLPHTGKRISYRTLKKGLQKANIQIHICQPLLPF